MKPKARKGKKETLRAFHNKKSIKEKYVKRIELHAKLDEIIQGKYWERGKGCATGCAVHSTKPHKKYETLLGIPEALAWLEDDIFERLSNGEAKKFAVDFLKVIPVGADLTKVVWKFKIWVLVDRHNGVIQYANEETKRIIKQIVALQKRELRGDRVDEGDWSAARSAAWSAARSAARSAAWSAARSAAWSAESAAWSAESVAWSAYYKKCARKLLSLLRSAK